MYTFYSRICITGINDPRETPHVSKTMRNKTLSKKYMKNVIENASSDAAGL